MSNSAACRQPVTSVALPDQDVLLELLPQWREQPLAADQLVRGIYDQLLRIARRQLGSRRDPASMQPSDLAQEVLLYLIERQRSRLRSLPQLLGVAALLMRRVLVARSRRRQAEKRGGNFTRVSLDPSALLAPTAHPDLLALDRALAELEVIDEQAVRVVEMRYFVGLSLEETADALGMGRTSVVRRWRAARAWLRSRLEGAQDGS